MILAVCLELLFVASIIIIDLVSKGLIMPFLLENGGNYTVWDGIIHFVYAENYGASFGSFDGMTEFLLIVTLVTVLAMVASLFFLNDKPKLLRYGILTVIGGGIGNMVDRFMLGYVRDFIDYKLLDTWFGIDFAIGNIADVFCIVGVIMIIFYIIFQYKENDNLMRFKRKKICKQKN